MKRWLNSAQVQGIDWKDQSGTAGLGRVRKRGCCKRDGRQANGSAGHCSGKEIVLGDGTTYRIFVGVPPTFSTNVENEVLQSEKAIHLHVVVWCEEQKAYVAIFKSPGCAIEHARTLFHSLTSKVGCVVMAP